MLRILHTGDLHLGRAYRSQTDPQVAERCQKARIEALERVIRLADEEECDYLVIAGDLFDTHTPSVALIKTVCAMLEQCSATVLVLPGNHDYCRDPDDPLWASFREYVGGNTVLLDQCRPEEMVNAVFYPCPCHDRYSEGNSISWLNEYHERNSDKPNIGLAHGAIEGLSYDREKRYYYMSRQDLEQKGMDLWLIGHTHIPYPDGDVIRGERIFNAGTHQQTDIADNAEGSVFLIELADDKAVTARKIHTGVMAYIHRELTISHGESLQTAIESLVKQYDAKNTFLRLTIRGTALADEYTRRFQIYDNIGTQFLKLEPIDRELHQEITPAMIDGECVEGSIENRLLKGYLDDPELLNTAYDLICRFKGV